MAELEEVLPALAEEMAARTDRGEVADYIPQLRKIDPDRFGIAVALNDGRVITAGDADEAFSIQSISKMFTLTLALGKVGDALWRRVGREPSGNPFNSIVQLEHELGIPRNPFINAGAIVVTDVLLAGHQPREALGEILRFIQFLADDDGIAIDREVAASERATGYRNFALANYMRAFGNLQHEPELALGVYFHHCAIAMSCRQLALSAQFLAHEGRNPATGHSVVSAERARRILALMLTCGHYDGSGDFAFRVGIPGKSGVGGGIIGIVPGVASIAVWSPGLNENGNSRLGSIALEKLTKAMNWSVFAP
ncbi:L-glutaminase [Pseudaminobacter salicylatoxidans]|uniref:Glutaminase n=1 Tax=Pseudaminobacter salicylatoxidans TaxID=93369 RepID=A0A316BYJ9_PSESE|nr:glutaminase [Pseudaminobacter salicylatoxidans]PWJ79495.1 L-glutaminase [Pseudaminobacter salicylatoxidans]